MTLTEAKAFAGIVTTDVTRDASLAAIIAEATDAVKRHCQNGELEATEYTQILPLSSYPAFILPFAPVIYDPDADTPIPFSLYVNRDANGNPALFTSDFLLTMYSDYALDFGPTNATTSDSGIVRFLNGVLTANRERPLYSLATKVIPTYGAVKVVYTAGYQTVPPAIKAALNLIVRKVWHARKLGVPLVAESLNGYSYSAQNAATMDGLITGDPTVRKLLATFCRPQVGGYS